NLGWLAAHGYEYVSFAGQMFVEFASPQEAAELARIFYPRAAAEVRRRGRRRVPYDVLGINPPRDLAFQVVERRRSQSSRRGCRPSASRSAAARRRSCPILRAAWPAAGTTSTSTPHPDRRYRGPR